MIYRSGLRAIETRSERTSRGPQGADIFWKMKEKLRDMNVKLDPKIEHAFRYFAGLDRPLI